MTADGAGAGAPSRKVATSLRSSEPSSGARADIFDPHARDAVLLEVEQLGGLDRQIDHAVAVIGAAVIDADDQRARVRRDW